MEVLLIILSALLVAVMAVYYMLHRFYQRKPKDFYWPDVYMLSQLPRKILLGKWHRKPQNPELILAVLEHDFQAKSYSKVFHFCEKILRKHFDFLALSNSHRSNLKKKHPLKKIHIEVYAYAILSSCFLKDMEQGERLVNESRIFLEHEKKTFLYAYALGIYYFFKKEYARSIEFLFNIYSPGKKYHEEGRYLALAYFHFKNYPQAQMILTSLLKSNITQEDYLELSYFLGQSYFKEKKWQDVLDIFEELQKEDPDFERLEILLMMAESLKHLHEPHKALDIFYRKLLVNDKLKRSDLLRVYQELAQVYLYEKDYFKYNEVLGWILRLNPQDVNAASAHSFFEGFIHDPALLSYFSLGKKIRDFAHVFIERFYLWLYFDVIQEKKDAKENYWLWCLNDQKSYLCVFYTGFPVLEKEEIEKIYHSSKEKAYGFLLVGFKEVKRSAREFAQSRNIHLFDQRALSEFIRHHHLFQTFKLSLKE